MKRIVGFVCAAAAVAAASVPAHAADHGLFTIGAGVWDINFNYDREFEGRFEYRFGPGFGGSGGSFKGLKPLVGFMANSAEGTFPYAGLAAPFEFGGGDWEIVPAVGIGAYSRGDGLDLGGTFEFHLGLSLNYAVSDNSRVGAMLAHISNAGINRDNPGINSLLLTWSWAF